MARDRTATVKRMALALVQLCAEPLHEGPEKQSLRDLYRKVKNSKNVQEIREVLLTKQS